MNWARKYSSHDSVMKNEFNCVMNLKMKMKNENLIVMNLIVGNY